MGLPVTTSVSATQDPRSGGLNTRLNLTPIYKFHRTSSNGFILAFAGVHPDRWAAVRCNVCGAVLRITVEIMKPLFRVQN